LDRNPFRRRGGGGWTGRWGRKVQFGVRVEVEGQTSQFWRRGGGGATDKTT
jgi:hypothetical protein